VALGQVFSENFGLFPLPIYCLSIIIFTITRGWLKKPGVAAVPIASHTQKKKTGHINCYSNYFHFILQHMVYIKISSQEEVMTKVTFWY
jgi:hypothetical protein